MTVKPALCVGLMVGLITTSAIAQTVATSERRFALPNHGHLVMQVPRDWKDQLRQPQGGLPPTIALSAGSGKPFQVLMTAIWPNTKERGAQSRDQIRAAVERGALGARGQAVERELPVMEFRGRSGPGFYFSATDRTPQPGEYKFMTQGIVLVGELSVTFTILTNEGQERIVGQALDALKGAFQVGADRAATSR